MGLHFVRAMRKVELLLPHNNSRRYGQLVSWAQSFLITRVELIDSARMKVGSDMKHATPRLSIAKLNDGNPAVESANCASKGVGAVACPRWARAAAIARAQVPAA